MPTVPRYSVVVDSVVQSIKPPCIGCEKRVPGCHGSCDGYKEYRIKVEEEKKKLYNAYTNDINVENYEIKRNVKNAKRRRR